MSDYKPAFERQKLAREKAEKLLEDKSRELYQSNQALSDAYDKMKKQKLQLIHQEKLASIGQLSAGVAHEINNPIGFVSNNLESLKKYSGMLSDFFSNFDSVKNLEDLMKIKEELDVDFIIDDINDLVGDCLEGANRISTIVKGLKNFSRNDKDKNETFLINECIESTLKLVNSEIKYIAKVVTDFDGDPNVIANKGNLGQVILNLIMNGSQAIEIKKEFNSEFEGEISITTKILHDLVLVVVKDNGTGIEEENLTQIFDPFFTTKPVGKGTGLGLSISDSIISKMGGTLEVETKVGEGTKFTINLPLEIL